MIESGLRIQKGAMLRTVPFSIDRRYVNRKKHGSIRPILNLMGATKKLLSSLRERELLHFLLIWLFSWIALGVMSVLK